MNATVTETTATTATTATVYTIETAYKLYAERQERTAHPAGKFDNARRWYPSAEEVCECCDSIRWPSRAYPYSYMTHCRTAEHVAQLTGVEVKALRSYIRKMSAANK